MSVFIRQNSYGLFKHWLKIYNFTPISAEFILQPYFQNNLISPPPTFNISLNLRKMFALMDCLFMYRIYINSIDRNFQTSEKILDPFRGP